MPAGDRWTVEGLAELAAHYSTLADFLRHVRAIRDAEPDGRSSTDWFLAGRASAAWDLVHRPGERRRELVELLERGLAGGAEARR